LQRPRAELFCNFAGRIDKPPIKTGVVGKGDRMAALTVCFNEIDVETT
jgi:hypothetical protein